MLHTDDGDRAQDVALGDHRRRLINRYPADLGQSRTRHYQSRQQAPNDRGPDGDLRYTWCGSCERQPVDHRAEPPTVSPAFWDTPALRDALAAQHIGRVARAYRRNGEFAARDGRDGVSPELLGTWLGLTRAQVSRIENGPPVRNLDTLAHWARVLQTPRRLLWFKLPPGRSIYVARRESQLTTAAPTPAETSRRLPVADGLAHDPDAVAMRSFRARTTGWPGCGS
jgi:transcriptional regulator with XRE-family HTH domain